MPRSSTYAPNLPRVPERGRSGEAGSQTVVRPLPRVVRSSQTIVLTLPAVLTVVAIVRWQAGALSASSVTAVAIAALLALRIAAPGISRANRR